VGLNFENYYRALGQCSCAALRFGEWDSCQCSLSKTTVEFRVFNSTTSMRKIHAYAALTQSMVAHCIRVNVRAEEYVPMEYIRGEVSSSQQDEWKPRLQYIFENLYFSPVERESVMYCIRNSAMQLLGDEFLDSLNDIQYVGGDYPADTWLPSCYQEWVSPPESLVHA